MVKQATMKVSIARVSWRQRLQLLSAIYLGFCVAGALGDLERLSVSIQTAVFWALPFWISLQEGFFEELGLDIAYDVYSSGAPQIEAAVQDKTWDVGAAGCVPNVIGGLQGIQLIAISNDESAISALVGNADGVAQWPPESMDGVTVAVTANSTVHYAVLKCLTNQYPNVSKFDFVYEPQSVVVRSLTTNEVNYGSLWPPDLYSYLDSVDGADVVCDGEQAGAKVTGGIMVREEFGNEKPDVVARFLAGWIRGIGYMLNPEHRSKSEEYLHEFNENTLPGYVASDGFIEKDFSLRPFFDLEEQLGIFDRSKGKSEVDNWYEAVSAFLVGNGVITANPPVDSYITDKYLKLVEANATLKDFAAKSSAGYIMPEGLESESEEEESSPATQASLVFSLGLALHCLVAIAVL